MLEHAVNWGLVVQTTTPQVGACGDSGPVGAITSCWLSMLGSMALTAVWSSANTAGVLQGL